MDKKPVFSNKPKSYSSGNEYIDMVDELVRKNRGSRNLQLYDTGSNTPNVLPEAAGIRTGEAPSSGLAAQESDQPNQYIPKMGESQAAPVQQDSQGSSGMTYQEFFQQVNQPITPTQQQIEQITGLSYPIQSLPDGGILYSDNIVRYEDGTIRSVVPQYVDYAGNVLPYGGEMTPGAQQVGGDPNATPIQSLPDGTIRYSDGSIRRPAQGNEGFTQQNVSPDRYGEFAGIEGLSQYLFGTQEPVTQGFGETANANRFYTTHQGVDYGAINQPLVLPTDVTILRVDRWDGRNADSTQTPYGNSLIIQLPNGEVMRLSHLGSFGEGVEAGAVIKGGQTLGTTGQTGNVTGPHLDVEVYDQNGQITNPSNFIAHVQQQKEQEYQKLSDYRQQQSQQPTEQTTTEQNPNFIQDVGGTVADIGTAINAPELGISEGINKIGESVPKVAKQVGDILATGINTWNPTGNFDIGISEALQGRPDLSAQVRQKTVQKGRQEAGNIFANVGKKLGLPELGISERIAGTAPRTAAAPKQPSGFIPTPVPTPPPPAQINTTPQQPNIFQNIIDTIAPPVQSAEPGFDATQQQAPFNPLAAAGAGLKSLADTATNFMDENIFKKKDLTKMGEKNAIGEESAQTSMDSIPAFAKSTPYSNNQDAFFKAGGAETYKDYLAPGVTSGYRGALSTALFNDKFYQNPDAIANVFGSTSQGAEATDKYRSYMKTQYPIIPGHDSPTVKKVATGRYEDGSEWRVEYEDVDPIYYENQYNKSVIDSIPAVLTSNFKFTAPRTGGKQQAGTTPPSGIFEPVKGDKTVPGTSGFKVPVQATNIRTQSFGAPSNVFAAAAKATPYSIPASSGYKVPTKSTSTPSSSGYSVPGRSSVPTPVPTPTQSRPSTPSYSAPAPRQQSTPNPWSAPKPSYAAPSKPAPQQSRPAPKPQSSNVFTNLVNTIKSWFK